MPQFRMEALHWNTQNYTRPSGFPSSSGFVGEHGFGHEEWNNSDLFVAEFDAKQMRFLYSQSSVERPSPEPSNWVAFYSSHDKRQELVGIAAKCRRPNAHEIERLAETGVLEQLWQDAWSLDAVKRRYSSAEVFRDFWRTNGSFQPSWIAPADHVLWLEEPVTLDPRKITGANLLLRMHGTPTYIDVEKALVILEAVPETARGTTWRNIYFAALQDYNAPEGDASFDFSAITDIEEIISTPEITETERLALAKARIGQGRFRRDLDHRWGSRCAATGVSLRKILRASHIIPWSDSTNAERLDPDNGLLLVAHLDALFDAGLISFLDDGHLLVSEAISKEDRKHLALPEKLRSTPQPGQRLYLQRHRSKYLYN